MLDLNSIPVASASRQTKPKPFLSSLFSSGVDYVKGAAEDFIPDLKEGISNLGDDLQDRGADLSQGITDFQDGGGFSSAKATAGLTFDTGKAIIGGGVDTIGNVFNTALKALAPEEVEKNVAEFVGEKGEQALELENPVTGNTFGDDIPAALEKYDAWKTENPIAAKGLEAAGTTLQFATDVLLGGKSKQVADDVLEQAAKYTAKKSKTITSKVDEIKPKKLRDVFGRKKTEKTTLDKLKEATDAAEDAAPKKPLTAVDESLLDPKTGLTAENQPLISKLVDTESDLLTVAEKKTLNEIEPELFKRYDDARMKTNVDAKAPKLIEVGIDDVKQAFNKYKKVVNETGNEIGKIKKKLATQTLKQDGQIDDVIKKFTKQMEDNNVLIDGRDVEVVGNSAFKGSEKMIVDVGEILANIKKSKSMNELLQGIKQLDNNIIFGRGDDVSQSIQGVAQTLRKDLKKIRDSYLDADELSSFDRYSETIDFVRDFEKGDMKNKISVLLNSAGTARGYKLGDIAKEIKRVTGTDVQDIGLLINTIQQRLPKNNTNLTRFAQLVGPNVPLSTFGIASAAGNVSKNVLRKIVGTDIMTEIRKAGMAQVVPKALTDNVLPK